MAENPDLWEAVIEEEYSSELSPEDLIEDLTKEQLKELSARLKSIMG